MKQAGAALLSIVFCLPPAHADGAAVPADVRRYIQAAEACQHFAGEWDSERPPRQRRRIEKNIDRYCASAQKQLTALSARYRASPRLRALLAQHQYESVNAYRR